MSTKVYEDNPDAYNSNVRHFRDVMRKNGIPNLRDFSKDYVLFTIVQIDRYVTFKDGRCKIGRTRYDGSRSWREKDIVSICAEIIWLWNYYECIGRPYMYQDEPWNCADGNLKLTAEERKKLGMRMPGRSRTQSRTPAYIRKVWRQQEQERKNEEKERKRIERFEREIAKKTRKTNR